MAKTARFQPYLPKLWQHHLARLLPRRWRWSMQSRLINTCFDQTQAFLISHQAQQQAPFKDIAFTYGEMNLDSLAIILEAADIKPTETLIDMGCGGGKLLAAAAVYAECKQVIGIELIPTLVELAKNNIKKFKTIFTISTKIEVIEQDFLNYDLSAADIVLINGTALFGENIEKLSQVLSTLKSGARLFICSKKIQQPTLKLFFERQLPMSWGACVVRGYEIISSEPKFTCPRELSVMLL